MADAEQSRGVRVYDDSNVVIQLAIEGERVALESPLLMHDDVAAGRLVVPGDLGMGCELSFHIACPAGGASSLWLFHHTLRGSLPRNEFW